MKVFLLALLLVALAVFGMCFNVIFRKNGRFPDYEVSSNEKMRQLGIRCMKEEQAAIDSALKGKAPASCTGKVSEACEGCALYNKHS